MSESQFSTLLGCIVKTPERVSLDVISWDYMPEVYLDGIWAEVQDKSDAPDLFRGKCISWAGRIWRKHKNWVKEKYFTPFMDDPEKLALPLDDDQVGEDQWPKLVAYWQRVRLIESAKESWK